MADNDYPFIRLWGREMGSYAYYINDQVDLARKENAPENVISRDHDGTWKTTDDILSDNTRKRLGLDPLPNSALPAKYTVTLELDLTERGTGVVATVNRAGIRNIYTDKFDTYDDAAARALFEIKADQAQS